MRDKRWLARHGQACCLRNQAARKEQRETRGARRQLRSPTVNAKDTLHPPVARRSIPLSIPKARGKSFASPFGSFTIRSNALSHLSVCPPSHCFSPLPSLSLTPAECAFVRGPQDASCICLLSIDFATPPACIDCSPCLSNVLPTQLAGLSPSPACSHHYLQPSPRQIITTTIKHQLTFPQSSRAQASMGLTRHEQCKSSLQQPRLPCCRL